MKKILYSLLFLAVFLSFINCAKAEDVTPTSKSSILIEATTGDILYEKDMHKKYAPASMTKIMTMLLIMENIDSGKISYSDKVRISKNASSMGGSQIFIQEGNVITVRELLKGIGIASANDASVAMAEFIGGSEDNFVSMMNKKAKKLGLKNTRFKNPHGLDEKGHLTTAYDLSIMARELVKHEDMLKITGTYEEYMNKPNGDKFWLVNTNKLIRFYEGMDGLKTGFTDNAGYALTSTAVKNNMRLISVVMKSDSAENRSSETIKLLEYGFNLYDSTTIVNNDKALGKINITNSEDRIYPYYTESDVKQIVKKGNKTKKATYKVNLYKVKAPISKKQKVGELILRVGEKTKKYNLITNKNIKKASYFKSLLNNFKDVISGTINVV